MPRGFKYSDVFITPNESELKSWGVKQIGAGVFQPHEMGLTGRASSQALMGRVTETLGQYKEAWPEMYQEEYRASGGSGALLEAHVTMGKPAEIGDGYHFYSAIKGADAYTRQLVHNVVNCVTGENIFSMTGFGCLFNLNTRKLVKNDEAGIAELNRHAIPAFSRQDAD